MNSVNTKKISFNLVLNALKDSARPFPPAYLHELSDLAGDSLQLVKDAWNQIPLDRKIHLLEDLEEVAENDTLVCFDEIGFLAIADADPQVRVLGIRLLWEFEEARLVKPLIRLMETDPNLDVRTIAASALAHFVYLGELEMIPAEVLDETVDHLLAVYRGKDQELVRRHALESLGFSCREEIGDLILAAYESGRSEWVASALYAMGKSAAERWEEEILSKIHAPEPEIQLEAIRAAGELGLESTREMFLDMLQETISDAELRYALIWSLSQIGGEDVQETLESLLEEVEDEDEQELIENALDNLAFNVGAEGFGLFDFASPEDDSAVDEGDDLSEEDEDKDEDEENEKEM